MSGIPSHLVTWEAEYFSGSVVRQSDGFRYRDIDRASLKSFRLVAPGEILAALFVGENGITGHNLVYRRRTVMTSGGGEGFSRVVWFILGWVPQGPILSIQPETLKLLKSDRFHPGAGPLGEAQPIPEEGETWSLKFASHRTDALLTPSEIRTPTGFVLRSGTRSQRNGSLKDNARTRSG